MYGVPRGGSRDGLSAASRSLAYTGPASSGRVRLQSTDLAHALVDALVDRQATDVVLLDLTGLATWADYFVIATVDNVRQARALLDALQEVVTLRGGGRLHAEGEPDGGWVLVDAGAGVIVHLFSPEQRVYYNLEGLWNRAQEVVRIQ